MEHDVRLHMIQETQALIERVKMLKHEECIAEDDNEYSILLENLKFALEVLKPSGENICQE